MHGNRVRVHTQPPLTCAYAQPRSPRCATVNGMWKVRVGCVEPDGVLAGLRGRGLNYDRNQVRRREWNFDVHRATIADERPGPPECDGPWEAACALVRDYEFTPPELLRAVYDRQSPLLGRELLLEGRFALLRFMMPVRITSVIEDDDAERDTFGWGYETLQGHLERGEVVYRVVKHRDTGRVEFTATSHSQHDPQLGLLLRIGWALFGRRQQLRFYREIGRRLPRLVRQHLDNPTAPVPSNHLVHVPTDARRTRLDRVALYCYDPVRSRLPAA